jgi:HAD superfamily hydrolase (TIGR01509 family)
VIIFDCNGVLVDSEPIAAAVAAHEFMRCGIPVTPEIIGRYFFGRRPADMIATVEAATRCKLPQNFALRLSKATLDRFSAELRPMPHVAYALTWLREPKCVASSSPKERIRASLETTDLARFFEPNLFSASEVANGKPAPDLLLHAAKHMNVRPAQCIVVEDSPAGVTAAVAAGMRTIGFVGGSHAGAELGEQLLAAGANLIVADMRQLKGAVVALRSGEPGLSPR